MKPKVFITREIPASGIKLLKQHCQVRIAKQDKSISQKELLKGVKWCDALLCLLTDNIDKSILKANPNLKVVANYAVGYDNVDVKAAKELNIKVGNTPGVLTDAVAEHTLALIFSLARHIPQGHNFTKKKKYKGWEPLLFLGTQLKGKTLGIIGAGRIGSAVAKRAQAMGMTIIYYNHSKKPAFAKENKATYKPLTALLKTADVISIHVPLTKDTHHLINTKQLAVMKKTALLINTARGPVINEQALYKALKKKQIAGAALDVFEHEPKLTKGLVQLDNIILTPHTASATIETREAMSLLAAKNILAALKNKKMPHEVNI